MGLSVSDKPSIRSRGKLGLRLIEKLRIPIGPKPLSSRNCSRPVVPLSNEKTVGRVLRPLNQIAGILYFGEHTVNADQTPGVKV